MRVSPFAVVGTCLIAIAAAGPSSAARRSFSVPGFDRVRSNVPFDVGVHTGKQPGVSADGDQDAIDRLDIAVRGGELVISTKPSMSGWFSGWKGSRRMRIDVSVPALRGATLNGPGNLDIDSVRARDFALVLSGPGNLRVWALETGSLDVRLSGPGDLQASGRAERVRIIANGPGDVRFGKLMTRDIDVTLNGPGNVKANATGTARLVLNGPGDIDIAGHPRCQIEKHGPGDITCG